VWDGVRCFGLTHVTNVNSPVMVLHGANDPRDLLADTSHILRRRYRGSRPWRRSAMRAVRWQDDAGTEVRGTVPTRARYKRASTLTFAAAGSLPALDGATRSNSKMMSRDGSSASCTPEGSDEKCRNADP
jgi:hypothetical protein